MHHNYFYAYKEIILLLAIAGIIVPLFQRLRLSPVLGYIFAGAFLGPFCLGTLATTYPWLSAITISSRTQINEIAELGVIFLMFMIGIELSWERLRMMRQLVFGLGSLQVFITTILVSSILYLLKTPLVSSVVLGLALSLSSTAVVLPVLADQKRLNTQTGRTSFAILLFQDLAMAPILFSISLLSSIHGSEVSLSYSIALALGQAGLALVVLVFFGRLLLRPIFNLVALTQSVELFMATCLLVIILTSFTAALFGLSLSFGAFIAGLLLAETEYRRAIEATIDPFKGLFLGIFFVSVGMNLNLTQFYYSAFSVIVLCLGLVLVKSIVTFFVATLMQIPRIVALETALLLATGGEFAFVIIASATEKSLVASNLGDQTTLIATVTMICIPFIAIFTRRLTQWYMIKYGGALPKDREALPDDKKEDKVIIVGYGRVGRLIGDMLEKHGKSYLAIDSNIAVVTEQRRAKKPVYYGNSANQYVLKGYNLSRVSAVVLTLDEPEAIKRVIVAANAERPDMPIIARAMDAAHAMELYKLGVKRAIPETIEASLQLSEEVLLSLGISEDSVKESIDERRAYYYRNLTALQSDVLKKEAIETL